MLALLFSAIVLLSLTLTSTAASALPTCVELGSDPAFGLVGNPDLSGVSTSLVPAAGPNAAYCQINITVSSESGEAFGYLPGQSEHIRVRVGLPLSLADGGTGGVSARSAVSRLRPTSATSARRPTQGIPPLEARLRSIPTTR